MDENLDDITVTLGGRDLAKQHHDAICRLHDKVFAEPPFTWEPAESRRHSESLTKWRHQHGFNIAIATGAGLVGFAYGFTLPTDHRWFALLDRTLPAATTDEWEGRTFGFINLAVTPAHRGRRIGRRLVEALLSSRTEARVLLTVQPTAERTQAIYRHLGYRYLGRKGPVDDAVSRYWDLYTAPCR